MPAHYGVTRVYKADLVTKVHQTTPVFAVRSVAGKREGQRAQKPGRFVQQQYSEPQPGVWSYISPPRGQPQLLVLGAGPSGTRGRHPAWRGLGLQGTWRSSSHVSPHFT